MDFQIIKMLVLKLADLIVIYNEDLKNGIISNIVPETDDIINDFINQYPNLTNIFNTEVNYGLNLELTGFTGKILFPAILYKNSFRMLIIRDLKNFLSHEITFNDFEIFISKKLLATQDVKKGGFNDKTLEVLRFYLTNFDKVIDNDVQKFLPYFPTYSPKYIDLSLSSLVRRFPITQKYSTYYLLPNFKNFGLKVIMIRHEDSVESNLDESFVAPFGLLFNNQKQKEFSFYFMHSNQKFPSNTIEKICFFENLDLFQADSLHKTLTNKTMDILSLYYDYKDNNFVDSSISFEIEFINNQRFHPQMNDLDLLIHLFNTRNLPRDHQIHPISKYFITYRNKIVKFYSTIRYFIYVYEPKGKKITRFALLFLKMFRNAFSNGYIIQGRSYVLISTFLFKQDFESQKQSLIEFVYSFKLDIRIFENLNMIPFSFYQLPSSSYFDIHESNWNFPIFQEESINDLLNYQIQNLDLERTRLLDQSFKTRKESFIENWTKEIKYLNEG